MGGYDVDKIWAETAGAGLKPVEQEVWLAMARRQEEYICGESVGDGDAELISRRCYRGERQQHWRAQD